MASHCATDAVKNRLPIALLVLALLMPVAQAEDPSASAPVVSEQCPQSAERLRERPTRECEPVLTESVLDDPREYRRHLLMEARLLELQVLGYGLLIGFAGKLAGRQFWRWFVFGMLIRLAVAAMVLIPL